jgi:hypothetical protein
MLCNALIETWFAPRALSFISAGPQDLLFQIQCSAKKAIRKGDDSCREQLFMPAKNAG